MTIKNTVLSIFLLLSIPLFSQNFNESKGIITVETKLSYLDSVKNDFVKDNMASCVDSLWMHELTNLDLYNDITIDIENLGNDEKVDYELPTALLKARLAAMNAKSPFRIEYNESLENVIKSFLKYRKKSFERLMAISEYYFPMFEEAFAKENVPLEIKYLAVVESALNPKAVSKMGATGLWQFMYQTGKQYDLKIDSYIDERRDPLKATAAAAQYMSNMYTIFGDWELVLASYNSGPGNVSKAIRRSGGKQNYWNIRKNLPKETQGYVPAFLATMYLYEYHKEHGLVPERAIMQNFETDTILIKKQLSFKQVSDLLDVSVSQIQLLNPSYKLNEIPVYNFENHYLRLPKDKIAVFTSNENKIYAYVQHQLDLKENPYQSAKAIVSKEEISSSTQKITKTKTNYYKIQRGDNLGEIANKYNVEVSEIRKWNNLKSNMIAQGTRLKIISSETIVEVIEEEPQLDPVSKVTIANNQRIAAASLKINKEVKANKLLVSDTLVVEKTAFYVVQKGDNLNTIAKKNNITIAEITAWNNLSGTSIQLGSTLQVAPNEPEVAIELAALPQRENIKYVVEKGDNLGNIAKKFGASIADLKLWNNLPDYSLALGKTLIVAKDEIVINTDKASADSFKKKGILASSSKNKVESYYVKKGDSLYSISKKYPGVTISDIKKWNDIRGEDLKPGMKLKING